MVKNHFIFHILCLGFFLALPFQNSNADSDLQTPACEISPEETRYLVEQIKISNKAQIEALDQCKKSNRYLVSQMINVDPSYFEFASENLKDDEVFISKLATLNPEILKYISPRLASDRFFISKTAQKYPDALKYASPKLTDNRGFMIKMIKINPENFKYASERLQDEENIALLALKKDGKMLRFASPEIQNNKKIVIQAIKSDSLAIGFASEELQRDPQITKLSNKIDHNFIVNFDDFLKQNYSGFSVGPEGARGYRIVNMAKFFPEKQIINNPYTTKWGQVYENGIETDKFKLVNTSANDGNWKVDFADYPNLIKEIENIFIANGVDQNTIDSLNAVSLWKISNNPEVIAFDLYLLRQINSKYLKDDAANIVALTAIAQEAGNKKWEINVVDAIFDADLKMDIFYPNGHRRYKIWDVYTINKGDKNPKILFKVEDKDGEYFNLFAKQLNNHYASIYKGGGYVMDINLFER